MKPAAELRPGVRASFWAGRKFRLDPESLIRTQQSDCLQQLRPRCEDLLGFNRFALVADQLQLEYDAGYLQLDRLLAVLSEFDIHPSASRWTQMRLGWYRYQDTNIRDNARNTDSTCCSQSPLRHR